MSDMTRLDFESLKAAKSKYRTLVKQIEEGERPLDDLVNPVYKLVQFLNEALPDACPVADPVPDAFVSGEGETDVE